MDRRETFPYNFRTGFVGPRENCAMFGYVDIEISFISDIKSRPARKICTRNTGCALDS